LLDSETVKSLFMQLTIIIPGYLIATVAVGWMIGRITKAMVKNEKDKTFQKLIRGWVAECGQVYRLA